LVRADFFRIQVVTGVVKTSLQATDRTKHGRTPSSSLYYPIADIIAHVEDPWLANAQPAAVFAQRLARKIAVKGRKPALVYEGASVALFRWISAILWLISFFAGVRIWVSCQISITLAFGFQSGVVILILLGLNRSKACWFP
jgi:hypothetical protein